MVGQELWLQQVKLSAAIQWWVLKEYKLPWFYIWFATTMRKAESQYRLVIQKNQLYLLTNQQLAQKRIGWWLARKKLVEYAKNEGESCNRWVSTMKSARKLWSPEGNERVS